MILGISAFYHDAAAALVDSAGEVVAAAQEERFTRVKHDPRFPREAVAYCLSEAGIGMDQIELVAYYEQSWVKFERILETTLAYAPRGVGPFLQAMPLWLKEKLWIGRLLERELGYGGTVIYPEHHESHAASAFFPSPFERAAILTLDGVGEWSTATWGAGEGNRIALKRELEFPHSLGLLYNAFTYYTGFRVNSDEYKVMGLAPYGQPKYARLILDELMDLKEDGSFRLDMDYFAYGHGMTMTNARFHALFGGPPREPESALTQRTMDLARSVQAVTEEVMLRMARYVRRETGMRHLCLAGGVALNAVGNGLILREGIFDGLWIQPAAGDAGGAVGAALFAHHQVRGAPRRADGRMDRQRGSYLGPSFTSEEIGAWLDTEGIPHRRMEPAAAAEEVAGLLAERSVVGWLSGRMEFGPRALGARSILADPRDPEAQRTLNMKVKFRESFRPFAPACLEERAPEWFDLDGQSPYMVLVAPVREKRRRHPEEGAEGLDRLRQVLSDVPAVTHVDYSARLQTVSAERHGPFRALIEAFEAETGCPMVVNTSFNRRDEPIVCTPADAYACFMRTGMDALVLEDRLLLKAEQPDRSPASLEAMKDEWRRWRTMPPGIGAGELRRFGLVMAGAFGAMGGFLWWRGSAAGPVIAMVAGLFLLAGLATPRALRPVHRGWMAFAQALGRVTNRILMVLAFYLVITPAAVVLRLAGRDRLALRRRGGKTYWTAATREGAADRYDRPY
ncbi:MAG TPA: SxtJ family membrane protein [Longimicrobiales bacterium]|nr:SxtJ family membrane protein [Longimicrobiales bacterium]